MNSRSVLQTIAVSKSFPSRHGDVRVLDGVDITVAEGEFVALTGPSGSGKTTLLNLAALLDTPTSGELLFGGRTTTTMREEQRAAIRKHHIGMVFQRFNLLPHRSALDNVLFRFRYVETPPRDARALAEETLARLGLTHAARHPAHVLSGGEMQRVAIARAIVHKPKLLLVDEPTGNLDPAAAETVMSCLEALHREGLTILLVTHNRGITSGCSRVLLCNEGRVTADAQKEAATA